MPSGKLKVGSTAHVEVTKKKTTTNLLKNIFACLFSVHNTISLSRHEQVCLMRLFFTFREILLPSSGNVNDYVAHI